MVRILIEKNNNLKTKDFSTCRSRVNLITHFSFFISAHYNAVNATHDFKITLTLHGN